MSDLFGALRAAPILREFSDVGVRILQLDCGHRQTINEHDHIWAASVLSFNDRELIDGEPIVCFWIIEIN